MTSGDGGVGPSPPVGNPAGTSTGVVNVPNAVSAVRVLLVAGFVWLVVVDRIAAAGWLLGVIGATDWVDGYLARRLGQVTELGKMLDPVADRLAMATAVVAGLIAGVLPGWFAWLLIAREVVVAAGVAVVAFRLRTRLEVRSIGKLATFLLYAAVAWWYIGVGTPWPAVETAAWVVGLPGLVLYWVAALLYLGDMGRLSRSG